MKNYSQMTINEKINLKYNANIGLIQGKMVSLNSIQPSTQKKRFFTEVGIERFSSLKN